MLRLTPSPASPEAEHALLGTILHNNKALEHLDFLKPEHFSEARNQSLFAIILALSLEGKQASPITIKPMVEADPDLDMQFIVSILDPPTRTNAKQYGAMVFDLYRRRRLIEIAEQISNDARDLHAPEGIENAEQALFDLTDTSESGGLVSLDDALAGAVKMAEAAHRKEVSGISTGLKDLDDKLGGLHPSDLIILAGRPSQGKTALALTIAFNVAKQNNNVAFFSLEMGKEQLAGRILSETSDIEGHALRTGRVHDQDFQRVYQAQERLKGLKLHIDDTPAPTLSAIRTRARRLARTDGLGMIVVDYLQLVSGTGENRVQEIAQITRGLKGLAKDLKVPVLALSQLSRAVEQREDKRPQLSDLRESGTIEQDSDAVMFVYREEYYLERSQPKESATIAEKTDWQAAMARVKNLAEIIIGKQRHGPIGIVVTHFDSAKTWFSDLQKSSNEL